MPRFQMSLILLLTGAAGFLISFALLRVGITWMWLRYPVAILLAYCVFLLLLRLWLYLNSRPDQNFDFDPSGFGVDLSGFENSSAPLSGSAKSFKFSGGGGDAGGGGAGGGWGEDVGSADVSSGGSLLGDVGTDLDLEDGWWIVLAVVAIFGALLATLYVVYIAPAFLAEILVDSLLMAGLYKRMKNVERGGWLRVALRRTWLPTTLVVLLFTAAGYCLQKAVPSAHSVGGVWQAITSEEVER